MKVAGWTTVLWAAAAVILVAYVLDLADVDLSDGAGILRLLLAVAAAVIAGVTYQRWSIAPTRYTSAATLLGLLGGAALVSTVVSAPTDHVYGSTAMATLGTVALVATVVIAHLGSTRTPQKDLT